MWMKWVDKTKRFFRFHKVQGYIYCDRIITMQQRSKIIERTPFKDVFGYSEPGETKIIYK